MSVRFINVIKVTRRPAACTRGSAGVGDLSGCKHFNNKLALPESVAVSASGADYSTLKAGRCHDFCPINFCPSAETFRMNSLVRFRFPMPGKFHNLRKFWKHVTYIPSN